MNLTDPWIIYLNAPIQEALSNTIDGAVRILLVDGRIEPRDSSFYLETICNEQNLPFHCAIDVVQDGFEALLRIDKIKYKGLIIHSQIANFSATALVNTIRSSNTSTSIAILCPRINDFSILSNLKALGINLLVQEPDESLMMYETICPFRKYQFCRMIDHLVRPWEYDWHSPMQNHYSNIPMNSSNNFSLLDQQPFIPSTHPIESKF